MIFLISMLGLTGAMLALSMPVEQDFEDSKEADEASNEEFNSSEDQSPEAAEDPLLEMLEFVTAAPEVTDGSVEVVNGTSGLDTLQGGDGDDYIAGLEGRDEILGGAGADTLVGGEGDDIIVSDEGTDQLFGGAGDDALHGRDDADVLNGAAGQDSLFGGAGDDILHGGADEDEDYLIGGAGDDVLFLGENDQALGGHGADQFVLTNAGSEMSGVVQINDFDSNEDTIVFLVDDDQLDAEITTSPSAEDPEQTELRLDGAIVALLPTEVAPQPNEIVILAG